MPHRVLNSQAWFNLSSSGQRLVMSLAGQYNGSNNGDLSLAWTVMNKRGWKSETTLTRAKAEILKKRWVIRTRKGGRNMCALYGLTFWGIDKSGKYDPEVMPANKPRDSWKVGNAPADEVGKKRKERAKKQPGKIKIATAVLGVPFS